MDRLLILLIFHTISIEGRLFCEKSKSPLEVGKWSHNLKHMDSAVVENRPVAINEGQVYVYENHFPGHLIDYINVDNVAIKSCGASAMIKKGGIGTSMVLIILHADTNEEIRSVIDIWGTKHFDVTTSSTPKDNNIMNNLKSLYLFKKLRAVNHNSGY
ncbi:uncharacterized protein LOC126978375 [Leptidea sinapis]|uniref:Uncharacterized protein n=1 Tax=Leptidea sinapis TaxID=189913 RepID=A0A5E4PMR1_9NEOP|nr:uncharacterized protein LOC126978375 [Leptidea sinapis]VVC86354.1 unnamed protein product [Leptidea sinapis]